MADQCLGRFHQVAVERNPVEMADHQPSRSPQDATCFAGGRRPVEPMPTLTGGEDIGRSARQTGRFRTRLPEVESAGIDLVLSGRDGEGLVACEFAGRLEHLRIGVDSNAGTSALCELARKCAGTGADVDDRLAGPADAMGLQTVQEGGGKPLSVLRIVCRGYTEAPGLDRFAHGLGETRLRLCFKRVPSPRLTAGLRLRRLAG